jgi:DMSO reductase family type II enzyme chaperone
MGTAATISAAPGELARTRQAVYRFLRAALVAPTPGQHAWLQGAEFASAFAALCDSFGLPCPAGDLVPADYADHESRYLACFEVGMPGPPVPLTASHYNRREPVPRILHEHILFYRKFGVAVPADSQEPADHLAHQLAFLVHLDDLLLAGRPAPRCVLSARHDFLSRHLVRWAGEAAGSAREKHLPPLYCALLGALAAAAEQDRELTASALVDLPEEQR